MGKWLIAIPPKDGKELGIHYSKLPSLYVKSIMLFENGLRLAKN